jgi:chromate transport protein ChrA
MVITIITLKYKSIATAINCFLLYNLIPWIMLTILGTLSDWYLKADEKDFDMPVRMVLMGCTAAGAGIMVRSVIKYFMQESGSIGKALVTLLSAVVFYFYRSQNSIVFSLTMGAVISLYIEGDSEGPKTMSKKSSMIFSRLKFNFILGKPSLLLLLGLFFSLWIYFSIYPENAYEYIFSFYWIGCMIIGPVEVIFAYFLSLMLEHPNTTMTQTWMGVAFAFLIPGSHLNIGIYFGSLVDGLKGALCAATFLYIPCFLFLLGMLPQWKFYRQMNGIKRIYEGLTCSTTGLTLSVVSSILARSS